MKDIILDIFYLLWWAKHRNFGNTVCNIAAIVFWPWYIKTHWDRYKMADILPDDIFKYIFLNENI